MKISLVTPAAKRSKSGNRTTAVRWARILRDLGHAVRISTEYHGEPADLLISIHAWRSAAAVKAFDQLFPGRPIVVALSGTDVNEFQYSHPQPTLASMKRADALVCLHDLVDNDVPRSFRRKLHVVYQSAVPLRAPRKPSQRHFDVCVLGHLRDVKDPLRTAYAVRNLPETSRIRVIHLGKSHDEAWAARANAEMARNPRYLWKGEVPGWAVRREFTKTQLMVISSRAEGGANVVSEAIVARVPVIATNIAGNVGLLGRDYPGYFPVGDTDALRDLLLRVEAESAFRKSLARHCRRRAPLFRPEKERSNWRKVIRAVLQHR